MAPRSILGSLLPEGVGKRGEPDYVEAKQSEHPSNDDIVE